MLAAPAGQFGCATVVANGHIDTPAEAAALLQRGDADLVALAQPAPADRNWPEPACAGAPLNDRFVPVDGGLADIEDCETDADTLLRLGESAR